MRSRKGGLFAAAVMAACVVGLSGATAQGLGPAPPPEPLSQELLAAAGAFEAFMQDAAAIKADFSNGQTVAAALRRGAAHQPRQMQEGMVAYAALVALQDPAFVEGVHRWGERNGPQFVDTLAVNPALAAQIDGADRAAGLIDASLARQGQAVLLAGRAVKQSAYDVQRHPWSKARVPEPAARLMLAKTLSSAPAPFDPAGTARLLDAAVQLGWEEGAGQGEGGYSNIALRGMALAALATLGQADGERIGPLLADVPSAGCVRMAKLNLFQCLAVSGPHYEDIFCLGQHAMMDIGQCVVSAASYKAQPVSPASSYGYRQAGMAGQVTPVSNPTP